MINLNNKTISLICIVLIMLLGVIALFELTTIAGYEGYVNSQLQDKVCYPRYNAEFCIINRCNTIPFNFTMAKYKVLNTS